MAEVGRIFEALRGGRSHSLSGQPVPPACHPHCTKWLPGVQREPPGFGLWPFSLVLALGTAGKSQAPHGTLPLGIYALRTSQASSSPA